MNNKNEETWFDLMYLIDSQLFLAYKNICKSEIEFEKFIFAHLMKKSPDLINKYKHLLDGTDSLNWVLENYPLTKIYLKD